MNSVKIGDIKIENPICLAPMAGFSSLPFRIICEEMGAAFCPTELVSARSIKYNGVNRSARYSRIDPAREKIPVVQLFGSDPEDFPVAVEKLLADPRYEGLKIIDINMGCPVPKVIKTGSGCALMKEPAKAAKIVSETVRALHEAGVNIPVTCKTRTGFDDRDKGGPDFVRGLAEAGASMICIHGRTRPQMYAGYADYDAIAKMAEAVRPTGIPVFANGDIKDGKSALKALERTGAAGIMVGRAARGNPWVFRKITAELEGREFTEPSSLERRQMLLRELMERREENADCEEGAVVREYRSVMPFYIKGEEGAAALKRALCNASSIDEVREILEL